MFNLFGKISDRIRSGDIPADAVTSERSSSPEPSAKSVKRASGRGLGRGALRDGTQKGKR